MEGLKILYAMQKDTEKKLETKSDETNSPEAWTANDTLALEVHELFGLFPAKEDFQSKFMMVSLEICRVHTRVQDFRNGYTTIKKLLRKIPDNPYILSKAGQFCLEAGRRTEAHGYFK